MIRLTRAKTLEVYKARSLARRIGERTFWDNRHNRRRLQRLHAAQVRREVTGEMLRVLMNNVIWPQLDYRKFESYCNS